MSDKNKSKVITLPRLVFAKDKKTGVGYVRRAIHPDFQKGELEAFSKIKAKFEWPDELRSRFGRSSAGIYPDCFGLYRMEDGRYFLIRFRDDGCDELGRPHTVNYEAVLYETALRESGNLPGISSALASFLDPGAWLEPDIAAFKPTDSRDKDLGERVKAWLTQKNTKLFINISEPTARQAGSSAPRQTKSSSSKQTDSPAGGFFMKLCAFFLLLLIVVLSTLLFIEKSRYSTLAGSYNRMSIENEDIKRTLADRSFSDEEAELLREDRTRLRNQLERIQRILDER